MSTMTKIMGATVLVGAALAIWLSGLSPSELLWRGKVSAPKAGAQATPILSKTATTETFTVRKRTIGFVEPVAQVTIRTRVDSQILTQSVKDGSMVKSGDVLFTLDDRELKAQVARGEAQIVRDKATIVRTQADLTRKQDLTKKGIATPQAYDQAVADQEVAKATLSADEASLALDKTRLEYTIIRAPISGRAGAVSVTPGNIVKTSDTGPGLVTITQISPIRISMQLSEREFSNVQAMIANNAPPEVVVYKSGTSNVLGKAHVTFLDSAIDVTSGTVTVKAGFENENSILWPGMFVDAEVTVQTLPDSTVVPTVSVQTGPNGQYVFVVKPDQTVELRNIVVAAFDGTKTAVQSGLKAGERVVVEGQGRLTNGSRIRDETQAPPAARTEAANGTNG
jgi:multidrug efflux system membrane fusion protein